VTTRDLLKSLTFLQRNILGPWSCTTCVPAAVPHQQAAARWWRGGWYYSQARAFCFHSSTLQLPLKYSRNAVQMIERIFLPLPDLKAP